MMEELFKRYPALSECKADIIAARDLIIDTYRNKKKILVCGNGGSAADSEHIVGELMKGFMKKRSINDKRIPERIRNNLQGALPAISLPSQTAVLSAFINDVSPDMMYAQLVYGYADENDLVMGISTSGNSKNIVNAIETAIAVGAKTLSLTGSRQSKLSEISTVTIRVPETETYKVQEYHLPVYHYLCAEAEQYFFSDCNS
ncbi:MAG: SIS domain-containing protein [Eubacteriales bacterium]